MVGSIKKNVFTLPPKRTTKGSHSIFSVHDPLQHDILMSLSFKTDVDGIAFAYIFNPSYGLQSTEFAHESAIFAAMINNIQKTIMQDPKISKSAKLTDLTCGVNSGEFTISWRCKKQMGLISTNARRILQAINPAKLASGYSSKLATISTAAKPSALKFYANKIMGQMRKSLHFTVITKFNKQLDWSNILERIVEKIVDTPIDTGKASADRYLSHHDPPIPNNVLKLKHTGWKAAIFARAIRTLMKKSEVLVFSGGMYVIGKDVGKRGLSIDADALTKYITRSWTTYPIEYNVFQLLASSEIGGNEVEEMVKNVSHTQIKSLGKSLLK
jgi:hypothetical protein